MELNATSRVGRGLGKGELVSDQFDAPVGSRLPIPLSTMNGLIRTTVPDDIRDLNYKSFNQRPAARILGGSDASLHGQSMNYAAVRLAVTCALEPRELLVERHYEHFLMN